MINGITVHSSQTIEDWDEAGRGSEIGTFILIKINLFTARSRIGAHLLTAFEQIDVEGEIELLESDQRR